MPGSERRRYIARAPSFVWHCLQSFRGRDHESHFFDERGGHAVHSGCNHRQRGESAAPAGAALAVGFAEHHPAAQRCRPSVARGGCTPSLLAGLCNNRHLRVALALPRLPGAPRPSRRAPRVPSHCRFRNRCTEYVSESGIKWMSGSSTKRQRE